MKAVNLKGIISEVLKADFFFKEHFNSPDESLTLRFSILTVCSKHECRDWIPVVEMMLSKDNEEKVAKWTEKASSSNSKPQRIRL